MTTPRIPDTLSGLTAATLTALSGAAPWIVIIVALPQLLGAVTRFLAEGLPAITTYRRHTMLQKHEDRFLTDTDSNTGLPHIEQSRRTATPAPADHADDTPLPESPP
ncbi:hypothetical protein [Streptomyces sp. Tue6028]|uniref:hypothetical protein n=1 Tax=Streptomyces sp. Tue6028 TaxID=2036037 RepID=UPI003D7482C6